MTLALCAATSGGNDNALSDIRWRRGLTSGKYLRTLAKRAARVGFALAIDPRSIPTYFATLKKQPLELGLPWISFGAIRYLERFLQPNMQVFEYGSGGSTVFFAGRCKRIVSVEDDADWAQRVRRRTGTAQNVELIFEATPKIQYRSDGRPFEREDFTTSSYVRAIDGVNPDVVLIDGSEDWRLETTRRSVCFRHVEPAMKLGAIIILDDSWAYPQLRKANRAKRVMSFWGVGPCRRGSTCTDIFFY